MPHPLFSDPISSFTSFSGETLVPHVLPPLSLSSQSTLSFPFYYPSLSSLSLQWHALLNVSVHNVILSHSQITAVDNFEMQVLIAAIKSDDVGPDNGRPVPGGTVCSHTQTGAYIV
jgi:hypothetical protein